MKWLRSLPSTNALVAAVIVLTLGTFIAVLLRWKPPEGWFTFVLSFAGIVLVQFLGKRMSWKPESPQQGNGEGT